MVCSFYFRGEFEVDCYKSNRQATFKFLVYHARLPRFNELYKVEVECIMK